MIDGRIIWDSVSNYLPTPLEVLRNPWMQWAVLLPREIGPEYDGIRQLAPAALKALGLHDGLTHMEWFRRPDGPGWSPQEPVTVPASGQAEFDLSSVPAGQHDVRLLAWATDPGATLAAVALPTLTFRRE